MKQSIFKLSYLVMARARQARDAGDGDVNGPGFSEGQLNHTYLKL